MSLPLPFVCETDDDQATAVAPPQEQEQTAPAKPQGKTKPDSNTDDDVKQLPPYNVVLLNDKDHTYEYVIEVLMKLFRIALPQAVMLTIEVDQNGRAIVWTGSKEVAELKRDQVKTYGPDLYAPQPVTYALGCVIEPAEGA